jgi:hypothetical protein
MPLPDKPRYDDEQLVQYLLGLLPSEDAERLDEASIADDDLSARLRAAEDDLVDAYVRGTLIGETRTRFESHYLSSPRRRERVAVARTFVRTVDRAARQGQASKGAGSMGPKLVSTLAVAAMLCLVAAGALLFQTVRLSRGLTVAQNDRVAVDRRARELEQQVTSLRSANAAATSELERLRQSAATAVRETAIALVLFPQTRSIDPLATLTIPPDAERLGFELRLESDDFSQYQVGLKDPAVNTIIWRSPWVASTTARGRSAVRVALPASVLKPQHYSLDLSGRRASAASEVIGSYAFQIVPQ